MRAARTAILAGARFVVSPSSDAATRACAGTVAYARRGDGTREIHCPRGGADIVKGVPGEVLGPASSSGARAAAARAADATGGVSWRPPAVDPGGMRRLRVVDSRGDDVAAIRRGLAIARRGAEREARSTCRATTVTFGKSCCAWRRRDSNVSCRAPTLQATFGGGEANIAASLAGFGHPRPS
jgi:hypothetical protein